MSRTAAASNGEAKTSAPYHFAAVSKKFGSASKLPSSRTQTEFASSTRQSFSLGRSAAQAARSPFSFSTGRPRTASICSSVPPRAPLAVIPRAQSTDRGDVRAFSPFQVSLSSSRENSARAAASSSFNSAPTGAGRTCPVRLLVPPPHPARHSRASSRANTFFSVFIGRSSFSSFACIDGK